MAKKPSEKLAAYYMYVHSDMSQSEIARILGVSEKAMSDWATENGWKKQKEEEKNSDNEFHREITEQIRQTQQDYNKAKDYTEKGVIARTQRTLMATRRELNVLGMKVFYKVITEFLVYLGQTDLAAAKAVEPHVMGFFKRKEGIYLEK